MDKFLLIVRYYNLSFGEGTRIESRMHDLNGIAHYNSNDLFIADYAAKSNKKIIISDPATCAIIIAKSGANCIFNFVNIMNMANDRYEKSRGFFDALFQADLEQLTQSSVVIDPLYLAPAAYYYASKQHDDWTLNYIFKNSLVVYTGRTQDWLNPIDNERREEIYYFPTSMKITEDRLLKDNKLLTPVVENDYYRILVFKPQ